MLTRDHILLFWVKTKGLFPFVRELGFLIMPGARDGSRHIYRERDKEGDRETEKQSQKRHTGKPTHMQRERK